MMKNVISQIVQGKNLEDILNKTLEIADFLTYIKEDELKYKRIIDIINNEYIISENDWNNYIKFLF